jgi:hypothetical protein
MFTYNIKPWLILIQGDTEKLELTNSILQNIFVYFRKSVMHHYRYIQCKMKYDN